MKKILIVIMLLIVTGCSKEIVQESEQQKLVKYLEDEGWKQAYEDSNVYVNEITNSYDNIYKNDTDAIFSESYSFEIIDLSEGIYKKDINDPNTNVSWHYTYDYKADMSQGYYRVTISMDGVSSNKRYDFLYDYKNGIKECTETNNLIDKKECNISGVTIVGTTFLNVKNDFLNIIESNDIDLEKLKTEKELE